MGHHRWPSGLSFVDHLRFFSHFFIDCNSWIYPSIHTLTHYFCVSREWCGYFIGKPIIPIANYVTEIVCKHLNSQFFVNSEFKMCLQKKILHRRRLSSLPSARNSRLPETM